MRPDLLKIFKPALLGRMVIVPYFPLTDEVIRKIIHLQLQRIANRVKEHYRATFTQDDAVVAAIAARCTEVESGARNVDHILTGTVLPEVSQEILARMAEGQPVNRVHVGFQGDQFVYRVE
jgi:type VI secretion system protein VasG